MANAGVSYVWPAIKDVKIDDMRGHMEPNVYGVVSTFQATRPLLEASAKAGKEPVFMLMGSSAGLLAYVFFPFLFIRSVSSYRFVSV